MTNSCSFSEHNGSMTWLCRMPTAPALASLSECSVRSFATTGTIQGGYAAAQEESKPKFHSISGATSWNKSGGGSRAARASATAASIHLQSSCMEKEKNLCSLRRMTENNAQKQPVIPAGHTQSHNRVELHFFCHNLSSDTKLYTKQRDAGHHRQNWEVWAWCVSLLHFLTTSNIIIVTHNTREYNCWSDYLQPLH